MHKAWHHMSPSVGLVATLFCSDLVQNLPLKSCCVLASWLSVSNLSMRNFKSIHLPLANARSCQWQLDNPVVASLQLLWDPVEWFRGERDWFHKGLPLAARVRLVIYSQCAFSSQVWMLSLEGSPRVQLFSAQECPALFFGTSRTTASLKFNPLEKEKTAVALGMNFRHVC